MTVDTLVAWIEQFGYAALFFSLWLGIVGAPIPDEAIVMTGGAVTAGGLLQPVPTFLLTYLGVVSGLSLGYVLGRYAGGWAVDKLRSKPKLQKHILFSERLVERYGSLALVISYFVPVVRHVMPYLLGMNRMPFSRYAALSYSTGLLWTMLFFLLGRYAGDHADEAVSYLYGYGVKLLWLPCVLAAGLWAVRSVMRRRRLHREDSL